MVLLLTSDGDYSCDKIIEWLEFYKHPYLRINTLDLLKQSLHICFKENRLCIELDGIEITSEKFKAVIFRKFGMWDGCYEHKRISSLVCSNNVKYINLELQRIVDLFITQLKGSYWITNPYVVCPNKVRILQIANECGLHIPDTNIINRKDYLKNEKDIIVKSVFDSTIVNHSERVKCMMYTTSLSNLDLNYLPNKFMPSLIQKKIEKDFEIRVFFLENKCYSMAIFSQMDQQTKIDYRCYNREHPNRFLPYRLPATIEKQICKFMKKINLNCGSIDLILSKNGIYYFLEINPVGQYGMVSESCNYHLDNVIAKTLIQHDN